MVVSEMSELKGGAMVVVELAELMSLRDEVAERVSDMDLKALQELKEVIIEKISDIKTRMEVELRELPEYNMIKFQHSAKLVESKILDIFQFREAQLKRRADTDIFWW